MAKNKKQLEAVIKSLLGIPQRIKLLGFYRGIPILHDPEYPAPDGIIYFLNEDFTFPKTKKASLS